MQERKRAVLHISSRKGKRDTSGRKEVRHLSRKRQVHRWRYVSRPWKKQRSNADRDTTSYCHHWWMIWSTCDRLIKRLTTLWTPCEFREELGYTRPGWESNSTEVTENETKTKLKDTKQTQSPLWLSKPPFAPHKMIRLHKQGSDSTEQRLFVLFPLLLPLGLWHALLLLACSTLTSTHFFISITVVYLLLSLFLSLSLSRSLSSSVSPLTGYCRLLWTLLWK